MATFVLVHGAWHGGWCWQRVAARLRACGHNVFAPTLTGLGERAHCGNPETGLYTHVADVAGTLEFEDLRDVILVGHSYGGMVITGVANTARDRISQLIFLDAFFPQGEQSQADVLGPQIMSVVHEQIQEGDGWRIPPMMTAAYGLSEPDAKWVAARLVGHPLRSWTDPVEDTALRDVPSTFIYCSSPPLGLLRRSLRKAELKGWRCRELAAGHDAMISSPVELGRMLMDLAQL